MGFGLVLVVAVILYFALKDKKINLPGNSEAEEILKTRYINGEIDEDTYLQMKRTISQ